MRCRPGNYQDYLADFRTMSTEDLVAIEEEGSQRLISSTVSRGTRRHFPPAWAWPRSNYWQALMQALKERRANA